MITLVAIERNYQDLLSSLYPKGEIRQLFLMALGKTASISPLNYSSRRDEEASDGVEERMSEILARLRRGEPIQYILGEAHFYGSTLQVSNAVLIPRPETEELVHRILQDHRSSDRLTVMDIGTGSGCIAISLAKGLFESQVWAMDVSPSALDVALKNAKACGQTINFVLGDILEWDVIFQSAQQFDIIVSNPPYITPKEKENMHRNVLHHEPHLALFVEEEAPLLFYDYIADFALSHLTPEGVLYFEINQYLGTETADMLRKKGFSNVQIIQDMQGADRIAVAKRD